LTLFDLRGFRLKPEATDSDLQFIRLCPKRTHQHPLNNQEALWQNDQ
jgi:hypothetical protein